MKKCENFAKNTEFLKTNAKYLQKIAKTHQERQIFWEYNSHFQREIYTRAQYGFTQNINID